MGLQSKECLVEFVVCWHSEAAAKLKRLSDNPNGPISSPVRRTGCVLHLKHLSHQAMAAVVPVSTEVAAEGVVGPDYQPESQHADH